MMGPPGTVDLARVDAHARAMGALVSEVIDVGPFTALLPRDEGAPAYAVPRAAVSDARDALAPLEELRQLFAERTLPLRLELTLLAWGELVPALTSAGLMPEDEAPLFVCRPAAFRPSSGGAQVRWVDPGEDLAFVGAVMRQGLELRGGAPPEDEVAELRAALAGPLRLALATAGALPAGTPCSAPLGDTTEISAVSTLPTQRRQGVAGALVSFLVGQHFAAGGDLAWACTADPVAGGLLYKLGFEDGGLRVSFVLP
jgi:GNAT superfamily N-acetyltransferase